MKKRKHPPKPTEEQSDRNKKIAIGAATTGVLGTTGAYVYSARANQKIDHAQRMTKEMSRRLVKHQKNMPFDRRYGVKVRKQQGRANTKYPSKLQYDLVDERGKERVIRRRDGKPASKNSNLYKQRVDKAHAEWKRDTKNVADKPGTPGKKHWSNVPHLKNRYSKYASKVAKLTGTSWDERRVMQNAPDDIQKKPGKSAGRRFRPKGIAKLLHMLPIFRNARLPQFNLTGKLGAHSDRYRSSKGGGKPTVGGVKDNYDD